MIVKGKYKLEIGVVVTQEVHDGDGVVHTIPMMPLREATKEEWMAQAALRELSPLDIRQLAEADTYYYEVSVD